MRTIYFDYNATTPLDPLVRAAMLPFLDEVWGNPSSIHHVGVHARVLLDAARDRAARVLGAKSSEVVFTSGGTESNTLAIFGTARRLKNKGRHLITSAIEHHAVLNCFKYLAKTEGFELTLLPVNTEGCVSGESLRQAFRPDTILVSIMAVNNEIGTIQPVVELGALCRERNIIFHTDAAQWFGKNPFLNIHQFNADLVSICPHKFYGPKGVGVLFIRSPLLVDPIFFGGSQENEQRPGTENLAAIFGLINALERFVKKPIFLAAPLRAFTNQLAQSILSCPGALLVGSQTDRLSNTIAFVVEGTDSFALLAGLDLAGICASAGAACSAGSLEPSHVVSALGFPDPLARSLVRFSLGRETTEKEIDLVSSILPPIVSRSQSCR